MSLDKREAGIKNLEHSSARSSNEEIIDATPLDVDQIMSIYTELSLSRDKLKKNRSGIEAIV